MILFPIRRTSLIAVAVLSSLLLLSCGATGPDAAERSEEGIVIVAVRDRPESLDPRIGTSLASFRMQQMIYDCLVNQGVDGTLEPGLALEWQRQITADGGERYRFALRPDVLFHDGKRLTAEDVIYTFETLLGDDFISAKKGAFAGLTAITAIDDHTVEFEFDQLKPAFLSNLPGLGIVAAGSGDEAIPEGSGPFRFVEQQGNEQFVLEANTDYWEGEPEISRLILRVIPDDTTRALEFMHGSVDLIINDLGITDVEVLTKEPGTKLISGPGLAYQYLGLNHRHPELGSLTVRRAIALAIDRRAIIDHYFSGLARPAESPLLPALWQGDVAFESQRFDPQEARRLLDEGGYTDPDGPGGEPRFTLEFRCSNSRQARELAMLFKDMLAEVGIGLTVNSSEWQTFYMDVVNGRYELFALRWVGIIDPGFFGALFHSQSIPGTELPEGARNRGALNRGRYANPEMDRLIEAAELEADPAIRWRYYAAIQKILDEDLPYIDLWYADNFAVMRDDLDGLTLTLNGSFAELRHLKYTANR